MILLLCFLTALFTIIAFLSPGTSSTHNPLWQYTMTEFTFLVQYRVIFLVLYGLLALIFTRSLVKNGRHFIDRYLTALLHVLAAAFVGCFGAFVLLLCIAWVELNIFSIILSLNPNLTGVTVDKTAIIHALQAVDAAPEIIDSTSEQRKIVTAIAIATAGKTSFYGKTILPNIPTSFVIPVQTPKSSVLLIDNTLIITAINPHDLSVISPIIGFLFVKQYFPDREIKIYPTVAIIGEKEYQVFRTKDLEVKIKQIDDETTHLEAISSSISATIETDKNAIVTRQNDLQDVYDQRDKLYRGCQKAKGNCQSILDEWDSPIKKADDAITAAKQKLVDDEAQQEITTYYQPIFANLHIIASNLKDNLPHELGIFTPTKSIRIALFSKNSHTLADYFETLTHEYLHYSSYVSPTAHFTDSFFEEGLTEYFARAAIQKTLDTSTNLGYPVYVKIITQISKRISDVDLADIYFTKDEEKLELKLNQAYGDNFYGNNEVLFQTLQYATDPQEVLKAANLLMKHLGGAPLTKKDLQSTSSTLN